MTIELRAQQLYACADCVLYTNTCTFCAVRCSKHASSRLSNSYCSRAIMHLVCVCVSLSRLLPRTLIVRSNRCAEFQSSACRASSSQAPPSVRAARGTHIPDV
uniref:Uncharacterized protein n=1 Tax=Trichogramma kaykai TaxID=54128 RepID=A0ABD2XEZ3_9HYME